MSGCEPKIVHHIRNDDRDRQADPQPRPKKEQRGCERIEERKAIPVNSGHRGQIIGKPTAPQHSPHMIGGRADQAERIDNPDQQTAPLHTNI